MSGFVIYLKSRTPSQVIGPFIGIIILLQYNNYTEVQNLAKHSKTIVPETKCSEEDLKFWTGDGIPIFEKRPAQVNQFPWLVFLKLSWWHEPLYGISTSYCGGSILNKSFVITAAHCVLSSEQLLLYKVEIFAGVHNLSEFSFANGGKITRDKWITIHENYNRVLFENDIALIEVEDEFKFDGVFVDRILLNLENSTPTGDQCMVAGWGKLSCSGRPEVLMTAIINSSTLLTERTIETYRAAGPGDSGGPLMCQLEGSMDLLLHGIVAGARIRQNNSRDIYTNVNFFQSWIHEGPYHANKIRGTAYNFKKYRIDFFGITFVTMDFDFFIKTILYLLSYLFLNHWLDVLHLKLDVLTSPMQEWMKIYIFKQLEKNQSKCQKCIRPNLDFKKCV